MEKVRIGMTDFPNMKINLVSKIYIVTHAATVISTDILNY